MVPTSVVPQIPSSITDLPYPGVTKIVFKLWERFYWPAYTKDVEDRNCRCAIWVATNGPQTWLYDKLCRYNVEHLFEKITMDLVGSHSIPRRGNQHILLVANYFSKWYKANPVPTIDAPTVANLCGKLDFTYNVPQKLHKDQKRNIESKMFLEMCKQLKINNTRNIGLHP